MPTGLEVTNLSLTRGARTLFRDLSFTVGAGEAVVLMGENGAGKTSLLRTIAGFSKPSEGCIAFTGAGAEVVNVAREQVHLIGHLDGLAGSRSARAELCFAVDWTNGSRDLALSAAERLYLKPILDLEVRKLSAGQRRRLALLRLVAAPRAVWLLDEPMTALDARSRLWVAEQMQRHLDGGGLIVAAAHDELPIEATVVRIAR